jgi:hypothetical protein
MVLGVCLIVKNGLAFSISKIHDLTLGARLVHGTLTIPTKGHAQPMKVDIFGVYGPATKDFAVNLPYWEALLKYVGNFHKLHHLEFTQGTRHIIIGGDWNSYLDQNLDIHREYNLLTPECIDPHLSDFLNGLANENLFFTDLMAVSKLTLYADYTYATKKLAYRSILDRVFTTIGKQHCNPTTVLDWGENFSDHRPVQISIDLNSLCDGWLEYPHQQFTLPRINIDSTNEKKMKYLEELTEKWCQDRKQDPERGTKNTEAELESQYQKVREIFVDIPSKAFPLGTKKNKDWKSRAQGIAEGNFRWMPRYLRALKNLRNHRSGRICISYRKDQSIQKVMSDYENLSIPILELKETTMTDHQYWDLDKLDSKIMEAIQVLDKQI